MDMIHFIFIILLFNIINGQQIKLRVGNIAAKDNGDMLSNIMEMAKKKMIEEGVIDKDFDIEIITVEGCGQSFEGVAAAAGLYHDNKVDAFFGPFCTQELSAVATMASYWNIPIFAYTATAAQFSDTKMYKTLIRTSYQSITAITEATSAFLAKQNITKVAIVSNIGLDAFEKVQNMEGSLTKHGIRVTRKVVFEEYSTANDLIDNGMMDDLKDNTRVIIPMFSSTKDLYSIFRNATILSDMISSDYMIIYPLIVSKGFEAPIFYGKGMANSVKNTYPNSIQIYNSYGYSDDLLSAFLEIFDHRVYINEKDLMNYVALYESFCIFAKVAKNATKMEESGGKIDGKMIWSMSRGKVVGGLVDDVVLDNGAERVTPFTAFYIDTKHDQIKNVAYINSSILPNCLDVLCSELVVHDNIVRYWHSDNGKLPNTDPSCGFHNENCDYTKEIIAGAAIALILMMLCFIVWLRRKCETKALEKMPWRIFRDHVQILDEEQAKSIVSLNSTSTKMSTVKTNLIKNHAIVGVNTHAVYDMYEQRQMIKFKREDLVLLTKMKQVVHDNVNPFIGMSFNEKSELLLLWKYCSRGTLQDVIYCEKFEMDDKFHGSFVRDITLGLEYLHNSSIGYHGCLTSWAALIDKNWMIKLTDYAASDSLKRWEKHGRINCKVDNESEKAWQKLGSLYVAPEIRTTNEKNRMKRMDQKWQLQTIQTKKTADIYAFGVIIYEILFRSLPYDEKIDLTELAQKAAEGEKINKPNIQRNKKLNPDMIALLQDCWSDYPDMRPTIRRVRMATEIALKTKGNLVDSMMRMMEEYANNLEKTVNERTKMAEQANQRAERLLFQLLPKNIAIELREGRIVPPKLYPSATVMFSDIVGFTKLCSISTPIEVVNLLNKLYTEFDTAIVKNKCYKVETIGDAYMVVSGIPDENGRNHVANIASVTLDIIELLEKFEVPHKPNERLNIRLGFATGPVAAAVIGLNSPRFCLFGETVNIASVMESSGEAGRIQMTESSKEMLENEYPEYTVEIRGINLQVKIPDFVTYWLIGKDTEYFKKSQ